MYTTTVGCFPALSRHVSLTRSVVWSYPIKAGSHVIALIVSVTAVASKSGIVIGRLYENNAQTIVNSGSVWGGRDRLDRLCCIRGISGFQCRAIQNRSKQKSKPFRITAILLKFTEIYISPFPGSLILPPPGGDKMRDPGNEAEIYMETPCWSTSGWAPTWRP